ncbi:MAG: peptidylprolyl isomerase [Alistipes sp.]|nr:peptidylprolyl isomerase [Candidatus Alistipes equi]
MKKYILSILLLTLFCGRATADKQFVMLDKVVATVGGSAILYSELQRTAESLVQQRRSEGYTSDRDPMNEALEKLLLQKLLYNQALIDSVKINTGDLVTRVENQVQALIENAGGVSALEKNTHMHVYHVKELVRKNMEEQTYAYMMQQEVVNKVRVVPGEVERYYKKLDKDSLPVIAEQYVYGQITRFPSGMKDAKLRARERLIDMRERIVNGKANFVTLARMYSMDGSAIRGGELEPMPLAGFEKSFGDALGELKPGQISEVVETQYGFHIIQLIDRRGQAFHCRHILIRPSYTTEELTKPLKMLDSLVRVIRADSISFSDAAKRYSDDKYSNQNGGLVSNHDVLERAGYSDAKYTATKFLREDFGMYGKSIDDYNALRKLSVGEVSEPYHTHDLSGNDLCKIVKLLEIIPAHPASLKDDYLRLEQMALAEKQSRVFEKWLNKKIEEMYIFIDPEYRNGEFSNKNWIK